MVPFVRLIFPVLESTPQRWIQLASKLPPELFLESGFPDA